MSFVYVIAHEQGGGPVGPVKIGVSSKPEARIRSLQSGNPNKLALFCQFNLQSRKMARYMERATHHMRRENALRGEWFDMSPELAAEYIHFYLSAFIASKERLADQATIASARMCSGCSTCARIREAEANAAH